MPIDAQATTPKPVPTTQPVPETLPVPAAALAATSATASVAALEPVPPIPPTSSVPAIAHDAAPVLAPPAPVTPDDRARGSQAERPDGSRSAAGAGTALVGAAGSCRHPCQDRHSAA
ncbi:hypothetical protein [Streptomyces sp. NPDC056291]|uniref:hypothetical protein n=1 Tax=Streptomyces sp. NPDC056291 TaxID=3345772 RepID=UPI0035D60989